MKELLSLPNNERKPSSLSIRWEHPLKLRYYQVCVGQDLFGDWVITKAWGGINQASGRITNIFCSSFTEAEEVIKNIAKTRHQRGYVLREKIYSADISDEIVVLY